MKILTQKTFGIPNWILGLGAGIGLYLLSQGLGSNIVSHPLACPPGECAAPHQGHYDCVTAPPGGCTS